MYSIIGIVSFALNIINPDIKKISSIQIGKREELKNQDYNKTPEEQKDQISDYIMHYKELENEIISLAEKIQDKKYRNFSGPVNFAKAQRILINNKVIDETYKDRIDEIVIYRNLLVHSESNSVDYNAYKELRRLNNDIQTKIKVYKEKTLYGKRK